ncbi:helix-turn-helix domain-containing protein [Streptomyces sp. T-3]|nr:helix-turn-helix domain-containing protein [Streptomyces sp. T-3]
MQATDEQWKRLGQRIADRRRELGLTQVELAQAAGVDVKSIVSIEKGTPRKRWPTSLPRLEAPLGWVPGSTREMANGGDPTPLPSANQPGRAPQGAASTGLDAELLMELATATPEQQQRVKDFLLGLKQASRSDYALAAHRPHAVSDGPANQDLRDALDVLDGIQPEDG